MGQKYEDRSTYDSDEGCDALVTGATGFLGRWLLAELTRRGLRVLAPIRDAARREDELRSFVSAHGGRGSLVRVVEGDLDRSGLGLAPTAAAVAASARAVFHLGARYAWHLPEEVAHRTNVEGTERVVDLAASMPRLERLVLLGGYRLAERIDASGRRFVPEERHFRAVGSYERSKYLAHVAGLERARALGVPTTVVHVSSVVGDSRTGETTQWIGLAETIAALARGDLPARVWTHRAFVPIVAVDLVARVLAEVVEDEALRGRDLTLLDPSTPTLDALVDRAAKALGVRAPSVRLPTWFARALPERVRKASAEALSFLDEARYPTETTDAWLAAHGLAHPDFATTFDRWVAYVAAHAGRDAAAE